MATCEFLGRIVLYIFLAASLIEGLSDARLITNCRPRISQPANTQSAVKLLVKELYQGMSNMYSYGVKQISKSTHVINSNKTKMVHSKHGAFAIRNGPQVCVSIKKIITLDQNGDNETKTEKCEQKCFGLNETAVLQTNIEEGGKIWKGRFKSLCCLWSSIRWLEFSIEKPSYKCIRCQGERCQDNTTSLTKCSPGEGCFSMVFTAKAGNQTIAYPVKGCTDETIMYSRGCWDNCRKIAWNYNMCIHCCYGNGCNKDNKDNATTVIATFPPKPNIILEINLGFRSGLPSRLLFSVVLMYYVILS